MDGIQSDRAGNIVNRQIMAANLMGDDSQQMERVRVGRLKRQNLPIRSFGLLQSPSSMLG